MQAGVHGRRGALYKSLYTIPLREIFWNCPFKIPLFAMQDGVHGRGGDLRLCHLHLFSILYTLSLCDKIFWHCPFTIPFFVMQDGMHGRCGDLRLRHLYLHLLAQRSLPDAGLWSPRKLYPRCLLHPFSNSNQCCGSMTFWGGSGSGSADPCLWDPDPAIFVIDLQHASKI